MFETHKHLNDRIKELEKQEEAFGRKVRKYVALPEYIGQYQEMPGLLERLQGMLETMDL